MRIQTGLTDDNGTNILVGDTLYCKDGYKVIVQPINKEGIFVGKLVCDKSCSCAKLDYSLNNGKGFVVCPT